MKRILIILAFTFVYLSGFGQSLLVKHNGKIVKFNGLITKWSYTIPNLYIGDSIFTGNNANMLTPNDWADVGLTIDFATYPGNMLMPFTSGNQWASLSNQFGTVKDSRVYLKIKRISGPEQSLHIGRVFSSTVNNETSSEITPDTTWGVYTWTIRGDLATDIFYIGTPSAENQGSDFLIDYCYVFETDTIVEENEQSTFALIPKVTKGGSMVDSLNAFTGNLAKIGVVGNSIMANNYGGAVTREVFGERPPRMTINNIPRRIYDTLLYVTTGYNRPLFRRIDHADWSLTGTWTDTIADNILDPEYGIYSQDFRTNYSYTSTANATAEIIIPDGYENAAIIYHKSKGYFGGSYDDSIYVQLNSGSISAYGDTIINAYRNTLIAYPDEYYKITEYSGLPSGANTITITKDNNSDVLTMWGVMYWTGRSMIVLNYAQSGASFKNMWEKGLRENDRLLEPIPWRQFDFAFIEMPGMNFASAANDLEIQQSYQEIILNLFKTIPTVLVTTHPFGCSDVSCTTNYYTLYNSPVDLERRYNRSYNYAYYDGLEVYNIFRDWKPLYEVYGTLESGEGAKTYTTDGQHPNTLCAEQWMQLLIKNLLK